MDAHGEGGGIKVNPPSNMFTKLVDKYAIKSQKGVPLCTLPQRFGKKLIDPPSGFLTRVHLLVMVFKIRNDLNLTLYEFDSDF